MQFNRLDLNLLVALDALLDELNITRAGERLNLSQSATSGALARLREYFRDELLIQVGRKMVPTPLAESLRPRVRSILLEIRATVEVRPIFDPKTARRHFRVMASDYVVTVLFAPALARLGEAAPGLSFEFVSQDGNVSELLDRGEIDFGVLPDVFTSDRHPYLDLFEEDFVCIVWDQNPLVGDRLTVKQYLSLGHITTQIGIVNRKPSIEQWFAKQQKYDRRIEVAAFDFNSAVQLVIGTNRVVTIHRRLAMHYARYLPLRIVPAPVDFPRLIERLQWHPYQDHDAGHRWVRDTLRQVARETAVPAR
jgi:LysR family nod box-dependent transcriptional activator